MDGPLFADEDVLSANATGHRSDAGGGELAMASTDGRSLRRERNRDAVIVALLDLIREGDFEPGTSEIAERAGVSHRSVFRYFDDLSDLVRTAIDHAVAEVIPMAVLPTSVDAPVEHRVEALVDTLIRVYNHTHAIGRVARARALAIPEIEDGLAKIVRLYRGQLVDHFAPELTTRDPEAAGDLLDAIQVLVSFESFDLTRRRLGRTDDEIRRAWTAALLALLS